LLQTIKKTLAPEGTCLLANHTVRFSPAKEVLYEAASEVGLALVQLDVSESIKFTLVKHSVN